MCVFTRGLDLSEGFWSKADRYSLCQTKYKTEEDKTRGGHPHSAPGARGPGEGGDEDPRPTPCAGEGGANEWGWVGETLCVGKGEEGEAAPHKKPHRKLED